MDPMLEHAARVLDHQPTRSMDADLLYRHAAHGAGRALSFPNFMEAVRERADRFTVIQADPVLGATEAWDARHRSMYQAALETAGLAQPLVILAERPTTPGVNAHWSAGDCVVDTDPPAGSPADVFADVSDALTHLLRSSDPGDSLHAAASAALNQLHAVRRALGK